MSEEHNMAVVRRAIEEGVNSKNLAVFDELVSPSFVDHEAESPEPGGVQCRPLMRPNTASHLRRTSRSRGPHRTLHRQLVRDWAGHAKRVPTDRGRGGDAGVRGRRHAPPHHTSGRARRERGRIRCGLCHATWNSGYRPVSACPGVRNYGWWDNVPDYLKSKTALGKKGLKASGRAKGCVPRRRKDEFYYLFDEREAGRKRTPSAAQAEALERGRRTARNNSTCSRCGARATRGIGGSRRAFPVLLSRSIRDPEEMVCEGCGAVERWELRDRPAAVAWARSLVAQPEGFVVLLGDDRPGFPLR